MDTTTHVPTPQVRALRLPGRGSLLAAAAVCVVGAAALLPGLDGGNPAAPGPAQPAGSIASGADGRLSVPQARTREARKALDSVAAAAPFGTRVPLDPSRAAHVASETLLLVDGRAGIERSVDRARSDVRLLGGHTVSFDETEGRPTPEEPCPLPIDAYGGGGRLVPFPCPRVGEQGDAAQLVVALPATKVEALLRKMAAYGEILGRSTQIVDAQVDIDGAAARIALLNRQVRDLQKLIATSTGDTSALRAQLAGRVRQRQAIEGSRQTRAAETRMAEIAMNLTTVRPAGVPGHQNWFQRAAETGWHRLVRLAGRLVTLLIVALPVLAGLALLAWPALRHRRRRAATPVATEGPRAPS